MTSYAKDIRHRVKDDVIPNVAKGAAVGSEKLAEGSEAIAEGARKVADKTKRWADDVTGSRRRRRALWLFLVVTIIGALAYFMLQGNDG